MSGSTHSQSAPSYVNSVQALMAKVEMHSFDDVHSAAALAPRQAAGVG